jgi:serine phosphatase RsbU (regulator of sigma subunit)
VFASGKHAIVEDLMDDDMAPLHAGTVALGIRHVLCTPLRVVRYVERATDKPSEQAIGVLYLDSRERGALVSSSARSALEMLSAEAALAIENARLYRQALDKAKYEQELKVAAAIQRGLLPAPNVSGSFFTAAASSEPCLAVGGDFFDYVDLSDGRFGFIVGDVAGKGSPAALLASAVTGMFGAESTYQTSPAALISRMNHGLFRRSIENRFLTTFYGVLGSDGAFTFTNGGHNAPVLVTKSGVRRLETGGMVLGLFEQSTFEEETVQLEPGDIIIAFSDGVTEAVNAEGVEYMDDRLLASIARHMPAAAGAAPSFLEHLLADVRTFCAGEDPHDDITLLMVRYDGLR